MKTHNGIVISQGYTRPCDEAPRSTNHPGARPAKVPLDGVPQIDSKEFGGNQGKSQPDDEEAQTARIAAACREIQIRGHGQTGDCVYGDYLPKD